MVLVRNYKIGYIALISPFVKTIEIHLFYFCYAIKIEHYGNKALKSIILVFAQQYKIQLQIKIPRLD